MKKLGLLFNLLVILIAFSLSNDQQVNIRNVLFASICSDQELGYYTNIDNSILASYVTDFSKDEYVKILSKKTISKITKEISCKNLSNHDIILVILRKIGNPRLSKSSNCINDSIRQKVLDVEKGLGCCSDFSKVFIMYAQYFGLQVREVSNLGHTGVEYWDNIRKSWIWIDPYNRTEIQTQEGSSVGLVDFRDRMHCEKFVIKDLFGDSRLQSPCDAFEYNPSQFAVIIWRNGDNYLKIERFESKLRRVGVPKMIRKSMLQLTGIEPGLTILTNPAISFYMRFTKLGIVILLLTVCVVDSVLIALIFKNKISFVRQMATKVNIGS